MSSSKGRSFPLLRLCFKGDLQTVTETEGNQNVAVESRRPDGDALADSKLKAETTSISDLSRSLGNNRGLHFPFVKS